MFRRAWKFILVHKIASSMVVVALLALSFYIFSNGNGSKEEAITVERKNIFQKVNITGTVKPAQSVDLAFERVGRVARVAHDVGARVGAGALLVSINNADLAADVAQAEASLKSAEAKLAQLKSGTRTEEIKVSEVKEDNARRALEDARANLSATIRDGYVKADDAVRNKSDQLFSNPRSANPQLNHTTDPQLETDLEALRPNIEGALNLWTRELDKSDPLLAHKTLSEVGAFLDMMIRLLNALSPTTGLTQATLDDYRTDIATGRTNVSTMILNLTAADEKYRTAQSNLALAQEELALKRAGVRVEEIQASEADVESARASVASAKAQLAKTVLISPINGTVTKQEAKVGQIVSANVVVTSVMSDAKFQVEAKVPEADIAKLAIGDTARISLDAYLADEFFKAKIIKIDPASTLVDGVPTYLATLEFEKADERVRSGMTANISVTTDERTDVLAIPQRAVKSQNGKSYVNMRSAGEVKEVEIHTGLRASDGLIEIMGGLAEGDTVIVSGREN